MEMLVFLHGWGVGPENYKTLINLLSKEYQVTTPNLSDLTDEKDFSWRKFAENLDKLIGKEKVYLVGTSLGGSLALAYATFYPEKVKAVVACEPGGIRIKRSKIVWAFLLIKMSIRALFYSNGIKVIPDILCNFLKEGALNFRKICSQMNLALDEDLEKFLPRIKAPVYLLWSKNPDLVPLWVGERLYRRIPTAKFCPSFSSKNHLWCFFEQEKLTKEIFKSFDIHPPG